MSPLQTWFLRGRRTVCKPTVHNEVKNWKLVLLWSFTTGELTALLHKKPAWETVSLFWQPILMPLLLLFYFFFFFFFLAFHSCTLTSFQMETLRLANVWSTCNFWPFFREHGILAFLRCFKCFQKPLLWKGLGAGAWRMTINLKIVRAL